jgi:hypothetical protein
LSAKLKAGLFVAVFFGTVYFALVGWWEQVYYSLPMLVLIAMMPYYDATGELVEESDSPWTDDDHAPWIGLLSLMIAVIIGTIVFGLTLGGAIVGLAILSFTGFAAVRRIRHRRGHSIT